MTVRKLFPLPGGGRRLSMVRDERGTSVIELAVAAPILLLFLAGISDLGRGLSEQYRLQQAVNRTLEMGQTGRDADYSFMTAEAAAAAGVAESKVVQEQWVECSGTRRPWTDECTANTQTARFVKITINSEYRPLFRLMGYLKPRADGSVALTAHGTLRVR